MQQSVGSQTVGYNLATEQQNRRGTAFIYHMAPVSTWLYWVQGSPSSWFAVVSLFLLLQCGSRICSKPLHWWPGTQSHTPSPDLHATGHLWSWTLPRLQKSTNEKGYIMSPSLAVHHAAIPGPYSRFSKSSMLVHIQQQTNKLACSYLESSSFYLCLPLGGLNYITL